MSCFTFMLVFWWLMVRLVGYFLLISTILEKKSEGENAAR